MKFSLHYSILLVAATVACVAAAPTTTGPDAIDQEKVLSVAHQLEVLSNKLDQEKAVIAQKKTVAEKKLEAAKALADKLGGEAATARELATGFKETAEQTRQTVVTSLGDAVNAYTRAKESYEKISGTPELDEEVLQNLKNKHENALSAIGANNIGRNEALFAALEADTKEKAADDAKTTADRYNKIYQQKQAQVDHLSACVNNLECSVTSIVGDNIEEPVDEINTAEDETAEDETAENETDEDEIDPTLTGSDPNQVKEDKVEEGQVDKDKTGTADGKAKTADDNDAEDIVDDLEVNKKAAKENDSKMKVGKEEESEMEVGATKITEQETPEDKAAEKKRLEEIAAEKEKKEKRVKDAAREAAEKKAEEVAKEEKASEKVNKIKKDKAAKKDEEAEVVAEEGEATKKGEMKGEEATKKGEMKGEDKTVQEEKAGENDETKGVDKTVQEQKAGETVQEKKAGETVQEEKAGETVQKEKAGETVQEEKAGESGEKKGEDKTKNAVVQDSGAKFNQPAVAVGILSVMFALAFGV